MEGKILKHSIVSEIPSSPIPEHIYILDNKNGTHTVYVSDENARVVPHKDTVINIQAGENVIVDNTYPTNPVISVDLSNYGKTTLTSSDRSVEVVKSGDNYDLKVSPSLKNINEGSGIEVSGDSTEPIIGLKIKSDDGSVEITDSDGFKNLKVAKVDVSDKANKDASGLTDGDIVAWKEALGVSAEDLAEVDTLQSVTDRGNTTTNSIHFLRPYGDPESTADLGMGYIGDYSQGNFVVSDRFEQLSDYNKNSKGVIAIGSNVMVSNSTDNIMIGNRLEYSPRDISTYNRVKHTSRNIVIGNDTQTLSAGGINSFARVVWEPLKGLVNNTLKGDVYPIFGPFSPTLEQHDQLLLDLGIKREGNKIVPFHNITIGNGLKQTLNPSRGGLESYQNIWIGSNIKPSNIQNTIAGNIIVGNEIYGTSVPQGSIIIGNYLAVDRLREPGELVIHNSTKSPTYWENALIKGNFDTRYLKINGKFQVNPDYAVADNSYTKEVVAKVDGTLGLRDKAIPEPNLPADIEEYDLISSQVGVIDKGNPNAPVGKLMVNNKTGIGTITIDILSTTNFNSNVDLVQLPDNCPWVPLSTIENDLPVPPHTMYITASGTITKELVLLKDIPGASISSAGPKYSHSQALKSMYIIKNNRKIRGKVFPGIRTRTSFTTLFRKI